MQTKMKNSLRLAFRAGEGGCACGNRLIRKRNIPGARDATRLEPPAAVATAAVGGGGGAAVSVSRWQWTHQWALATACRTG